MLNNEANEYPEELDPYQILNIPVNSSPQQTKMAFLKQLNSNRSYACLAYDMICNKDNYIQNKSKYKVKIKDEFYYVQVGGFKELKQLINQYPSLVQKKDKLDRSLLYLAARNGYFNICHYLIQKGADINAIQSTGSTPLHAAYFYGNKEIVQLLLKYGANTNLKNKYNNIASNEDPRIKEITHNKKGDLIFNIFEKLKDNNLADSLKNLPLDGKIIAKKIIRKLNYDNMSNILNKWITCWHGTNFNALESIMDSGLLIPGSQLKNGTRLESKLNHINRKTNNIKIKDWNKAIFVSPSIFYALNETYSERFNSNGEQWGILIETKVNPQSFSLHESSIINYHFLQNEPKNIEYRINSEKNVMVISIVFVNFSFIENSKNYNYITNIFQNFDFKGSRNEMINSRNDLVDTRNEMIDSKKKMIEPEREVIGPILGNIIEFDKLLLKDNNYFNFMQFIKKTNKNSLFCDVSIFDKEKYQKIKKEFYSKNKFTDLEKSAMGCIVGMAIGDAMGARVEFQPLSYSYKEVKDMGKGIGGRFKLKPGQWTDDSSMGLCLADSLIENNGEFIPRDIMIRFILWWNCGYNNCFRLDKERSPRVSIGLGKNTSGSFSSFISNGALEDYTSYGNKTINGNGSIIRNAAIPICFFGRTGPLGFAEKQSKITHQGDEAAGCCQLLTLIIMEIFKGEDLKKILDNLYDNFRSKYESVKYMTYSIKEDKNNEINWNWKDNNFKYNEKRVAQNPGYIGSYCMDCMAMALHILYTTKSFKEAILKSVNLRGDADSLSAVVGQIAGAYYGIDAIPKEWKEALNQWDNNEIALRGYILHHLFD